MSKLLNIMTGNRRMAQRVHTAISHDTYAVVLDPNGQPTVVSTLAGMTKIQEDLRRLREAKQKGQQPTPTAV